MGFFRTCQVCRQRWSTQKTKICLPVAARRKRVQKMLGFGCWLLKPRKQSCSTTGSETSQRFAGAQTKDAVQKHVQARYFIKRSGIHAGFYFQTFTVFSFGSASLCRLLRNETTVPQLCQRKMRSQSTRPFNILQAMACGTLCRGYRPRNICALLRYRPQVTRQRLLQM